MTKSFRDLIVWQRGIAVTESVYRLTQCFPGHGLYGLSSQLRRSAASVPLIIAEEHGRDSTKEYLHHLFYAMGLFAVVETRLIIASRLECVTCQMLQQVINECDEIGRMVRAIQKSLRE